MHGVLSQLHHSTLPSPEPLLVEDPTPRAALVVPASTHRAQTGAPGCSDPPPTFNLMETNVGDNYP